MNDDIKNKTREIAQLYFSGVTDEKPFDLWRAFDTELAKELSLFITGRMYGHEKIDHPSRQLITVAVLTALGRSDELKLHIQAALNVGCPPGQLAEVIFQTFTYAGMPTVNMGLKVLRAVLQERGQWPISAEP
jgi:4-carboxymuconolactone decarboxylase